MPWHRLRRRPLQDAAADARYALRGLRHSPGFALAAVLTLALGIGASTAVFSAAHAVLLAPLPYPAPERLVRIFQQSSPTNRWTVSNADWQALRDQRPPSLASVALLQAGGAALSTPSGAQWVRVARVTAGFFTTLGVPMARGPGLREGDDRPGAPPLVVVSEAFAAQHLGGGDALGRTLVLDRVPHTVVGVLPGGAQRHAGVLADLWPVLQLSAPERRGPFGFVAIARLREGATLDAAARELDVLSRRLFPLWASSFRDANARLTPYRLHDVLTADASRPLGVLAGAVGLVLLIAVANVANLVLVRAAGRERELAVRAALGAGRGRLARMLLTESFVLAGLGGLAGLALSVAGLAALRAVGPALPRLETAGLDARAVGFALVLALVSGALVGLYPLALGLTRPLAASMRSGDARAGASRGARLVQGGLVVGELGLALPLLLGAGLLLASFLRLQQVDVGFAPERILTATVSEPGKGEPDPVALERFWAAVLERVQAEPGVESAALTTSLPPDNGGDVNNFNLVDRPVGPDESEPTAPWAWVTPGLLPTLGVPLLDGRALQAGDGGANGPPVALVSRAWAQRHYPGESVLGRQFRSGGCSDCPPTTVVGVVGDVKYLGLAQGAEAVYEPARGGPFRTMNLVLRSSLSAAALAGPLREAVRAVDADAPVRDLSPMEERLATSVATPLRLTWLVGAFATVAVALAALGVFGVMAYAVAQQRRELGVRMALGAAPGAIVRGVMRQGALRALAGLVLGLAAALPGTRALQSVLFEVRPTEPLALAAAALALLGVAMLACWVPARRAARIPPAELLARE
ncbi:FtsX-like permease family protein [Aggregicoccus sp. 17bor-14]|uniref:ADOP family duplicated permease n=1 Tax=Myxococcaceae TaxID=31 RepID=UPI00129CE3FD|nr:MULTISPECIES: ADOP family duplicated permease [Myxococcaceae]MBF5042254.1 ABC transporter permease [Simulacricoccus sp. 17bor-14]MRI88029.1 FtsX-like permease family protein [Aggregicoccus sp. 17bor-14]